MFLKKGKSFAEKNIILKVESLKTYFLGSNQKELWMTFQIMNLNCNNDKWSFINYYSSITYGFILNIHKAYLWASLTLEKTRVTTFIKAQEIRWFL